MVKIITIIVLFHFDNFFAAHESHQFRLYLYWENHRWTVDWQYIL